MSQQKKDHEPNKPGTRQNPQGGQGTRNPQTGKTPSQSSKTPNSSKR